MMNNVTCCFFDTCAVGVQQNFAARCTTNTRAACWYANLHHIPRAEYISRAFNYIVLVGFCSAKSFMQAWILSSHKLLHILNERCLITLI